MTRLPLITVCLTTRNQRAYIKQCIESAVTQQGPFRLEVLVGDDASDDGTSDLIASMEREWRGVVVHIRHPVRIGPSANTKSLVAKANGQYIARLDGDDFWLEDKLRIQLEAIERCSDCSAVYTNAITANEAGVRIGLFNDAGDIRLDLASLLAGGNFLNNSSMLCRAAHRDAWLSTPDPILDFRLHLMHARHGDVLHIGRPLVVYRVGTSGSMVKESNAHVRNLYWEAILSVPREIVGDRTYAFAVTDFLRRVMFRAMASRDARLLTQWARRVYAASPYGKLTTSALVAANACRCLMKIGLDAVQGKHADVLYRR